MTDIVEKVFVTIAAFVFAFAFGWQGSHSYRMPPAQARSDFGPDTVPDGPDDASGARTMPHVGVSIHQADLAGRTRGAWSAPPKKPSGQAARS